MYKNFFKRVLDFLIVLTALLIIWPFLLIITIWLHFANKGAVLSSLKSVPERGRRFSR